MTSDSSATTPTEKEVSVKCTDLNFSYQTDRLKKIQVLFNIDFELKKGQRCILLGPNGAGKSTLLNIIAGKHLVQSDTCLALGKQCYSQTLGLSGVAYLGNNWTRTVAFVGSQVPYQADIPVRDMMRSLQEEFPERRDKLMKMLEIDPEWRMHMVSDGQRRRIQILLGLLRPYQLLLIDEMTVDLDVLARQTFLDFLKVESEEKGVTIIYATHIYDAMDGWATHLAHVDSGRVKDIIPTSEIQGTLYQYAVKYLTALRDERQRNKKDNDANDETIQEEKKVEPFSMPRNGFTPGRMLSYMQ